MNCKELPPNEDFHKELRNCNLLQKEQLEYQKLICSGLTTESALVKMRPSETPPTRAENYSFCRKCGTRNICSQSKTFCAGTKTKTFQHSRLCRKGSSFISTKVLICSILDVLYITWPAFFCTVPCAILYAFTESEKGLPSRVREYMVGGPSLVFTRKAVVDETHLCKFTKVFKSNVWIETSQFYTYSICQPLPTGLYTKNRFDVRLQRFKPRWNEYWSLENMVMSYFQRMRPDCRIEIFHTTGTQKKIDYFNADWVVRALQGVVPTLQQIVQSYVVFSSLLSLSRCTTCSNWKKVFNKDENRGK